MKLKNPLITNKLRVFYFENNWTHKEIQSYLVEHYNISVCIRTLKYWKKQLKDINWKHPTNPIPPIPKKTLNKAKIKRIVNFREKTGRGALAIKHVFKFDCSESTIRRLIKNEGLSRGSKIENMRIHWVKWQRDHPDSLWQMDGSPLEDKSWILPIVDDCSNITLELESLIR